MAVMDTSIRAHADAMRRELNELVAELIAELGPTAVQAMTGTRDRLMPPAWARGCPSLGRRALVRLDGSPH